MKTTVFDRLETSIAANVDIAQNCAQVLFWVYTQSFTTIKQLFEKGRAFKKQFFPDSEQMFMLFLMKNAIGKYL